MLPFFCNTILIQATSFNNPKPRNRIVHIALCSRNSCISFKCFFLISKHHHHRCSILQGKSRSDAKCGNISIPYPFGIIKPNGDECSIDGVGYEISETEIRIKNTLATLCYNKFGNITLDSASGQDIDVSSSPFTLSNTKNMFFGIGCKTSVISGSCFGNKVLLSTIPNGLKRFRVSLLARQTREYFDISSFNPCSYAFIGEQDRYTFNASDILDGNMFTSKGKDVPIVLDWAIGYENCEEAQKNLTNFGCQANTYCTNSNNNPGYRCSCNDGYLGNPYLSPGCQ
ncbi:hypothetical protein MKW92_049103, partial [Papaver armeniacum]